MAPQLPDLAALWFKHRDADLTPLEVPTIQVGSVYHTKQHAELAAWRKAKQDGVLMRKGGKNYNEFMCVHRARAGRPRESPRGDGSEGGSQCRATANTPSGTGRRGTLPPRGRASSATEAQCASSWSVVVEPVYDGSLERWRVTSVEFGQACTLGAEGPKTTTNDFADQTRLVVAKFLWETGEGDSTVVKAYAQQAEAARFGNKVLTAQDVSRLNAGLRVLAMNAFLRTAVFHKMATGAATILCQGQLSVHNPELRPSVFVAPENSLPQTRAGPSSLHVIEECLPHTGMPWLMVCFADYEGIATYPIAWTLSAAKSRQTWERFAAGVAGSCSVSGLKARIPAKPAAVSAVARHGLVPVIDVASVRPMLRLSSDTPSIDALANLMHAMHEERSPEVEHSRVIQLVGGENHLRRVVDACAGASVKDERPVPVVWTAEAASPHATEFMRRLSFSASDGECTAPPRQFHTCTLLAMLAFSSIADILQVAIT